MISFLSRRALLGLTLLVAGPLVMSEAATQSVTLKTHSSDNSGSDGKKMDMIILDSQNRYATFDQNFGKSQESTADLNTVPSNWMSHTVPNNIVYVYVKRRDEYSPNTAYVPNDEYIKMTQLTVGGSSIGDFDISYDDGCGTGNNGKRTCMKIFPGYIYEINLSTKDVSRKNVSGFRDNHEDDQSRSNLYDPWKKNPCLLDMTCFDYPPTDPLYSQNSGNEFKSVFDPNMYYTVSINGCYFTLVEWHEGNYMNDIDGKQILCPTPSASVNVGEALLQPQAHWRFEKIVGQDDHRYRMINRGTGREVQVCENNADINGNTWRLCATAGTASSDKHAKEKSVFIRGRGGNNEYVLMPDFNAMNTNSWSEDNLGSLYWEQHMVHAQSDAFSENVQIKATVKIVPLDTATIRADTNVLGLSSARLSGPLTNANRDTVLYALDMLSYVSSAVPVVGDVAGGAFAVASATVGHFWKDNTMVNALNKLAKEILEQAYEITTSTVAQQQIKDANDFLLYTTQKYLGSFQHLRTATLTEISDMDGDYDSYLKNIEHLLIPKLLDIMTDLVQNIVIRIIDTSYDTTDDVTYHILEGGWDLAVNGFSQAATMVIDMMAIFTYAEHAKVEGLGQTGRSCADLVSHVKGITGYDEFLQYLKDAKAAQWTRKSNNLSSELTTKKNQNNGDCFVRSSEWGAIYWVSSASSNSCNSKVDEAKTLFIAEQAFDFENYSYRMQELEGLYDSLDEKLEHMCERFGFHPEKYLGVDVADHAAELFPHNKGDHWVACGSGISGSCSSQASFVASDEEFHEVRCCSDTSISGYAKTCTSPDLWAETDLSYDWATEGNCHIATYDEASLICLSTGGRLCSKQEIENGCAKGTGCGFDWQHVWTSDASVIV